MPRYAVVFFAMAIFALVAGFAGILAAAASITQVTFFLFLIFAVVTSALARPGAQMTHVHRYGKGRND